jgi:hypothetical protein
MSTAFSSTSGAACPPVLLLAFNRRDTTQRVVDALRPVRPARVFFAVDGPRPGNAGEAESVAAVRRLAEQMDWGCEVRTLFQDANLGCKLAVSQAISWFFSEVESGIILEDDCVAHPSFFPFAAELLDRYRNDERIMMVSGDNFQQGRRRTDYSYYFSRYTHIWGWATWRRAWRLYDHSMAAWPEMRQGGWLMDILGERKAADYWTRIFDDTHGERNTSWAYRWTFSAWSHSALTILPNVNLVSNIGFGDQATHTKRHDEFMASLDLAEMAFPLKHPPFVVRDERSDASTQARMFSVPSIWQRAARRAKRALAPSAVS